MQQENFGAPEQVWSSPVAPVSQPTVQKTPFYKKWYSWAILSGFLLVSLIVAIVVMILVADSRVREAEAIARYDANMIRLDTTKNEYERTLDEFVRESYGQGDKVSSIYFYPSTDEISEMQLGCLQKHGANSEDLDFANQKPTSDSLKKSGKSISEASERIASTARAYESAAKNIAKCSDEIFAPVYKQLAVSESEISVLQESADKASFSKLITLTNQTDKDILISYIVYELQDKDGIKLFELSSYPNLSIAPSASSSIDILKTTAATTISTVLGGSKDSVQIADSFKSNKAQLKSIRFSFKK